MFTVPEAYRINEESLSATKNAGNHGLFKMPSCERRGDLFVRASNEMYWEHVAVRALFGNRFALPTIEEMLQVKNLFWRRGACVVQYYPPFPGLGEAYSNAVHLWRSTLTEFPLPKFIPFEGSDDGPQCFTAAVFKDSACNSISSSAEDAT